ncbi:protein of unknown function [Streptomyces sp. KY75]|nr:protein of unknown function [Streptomyces sp. KY75]
MIRPPVPMSDMTTGHPRVGAPHPSWAPGPNPGPIGADWSPERKRLPGDPGEGAPGSRVRRSVSCVSR